MFISLFLFSIPLFHRYPRVHPPPTTLLTFLVSGRSRPAWRALINEDLPCSTSVPNLFSCLTLKPYQVVVKQIGPLHHLPPPAFTRGGPICLATTCPQVGASWSGRTSNFTVDGLPRTILPTSLPSFHRCGHYLWY